MVIERDKSEWAVDPTKPDCRQIMKIPGTVESEWSEAPRKFISKGFNDPRRRAETKLRPPFACFNRRQLKCLVRPRVVQPAINRALQKLLPVDDETSPVCASMPCKSCWASTDWGFSRNASENAVTASSVWPCRS